ncbi:MAG: hypothetical protein NTY46_14735 [Candidatus Sumerlaeota bacterium]|nr:hypothetical protein [Candidatus Sumerlaeota bacterium]
MASARASVIGFEPPVYTVGGTLPAGWDISASNAYVTDVNPLVETQSLNIMDNGTVDLIYYDLPQPVPASGATTISVVMRLVDYYSPVWNFMYYGSFRVRNMGDCYSTYCTECTVSFDIYNGARNIYLYNGVGCITGGYCPGMIASGIFTAGTTYKISMGIDWTAKTRNYVVEDYATGGVVAQRTFTLDQSIPIRGVMLGGGYDLADPKTHPTTFDQLTLPDVSTVKEWMLY